VNNEFRTKDGFLVLDAKLNLTKIISIFFFCPFLW